MKALAAGPLPDCVLLDVEMPVLSGPEMAHQMLLHNAGEDADHPRVRKDLDLAEIARSIGTPYFIAKGVPDYGRQPFAMLELALRRRHAPAAA